LRFIEKPGENRAETMKCSGGDSVTAAAYVKCVSVLWKKGEMAPKINYDQTASSIVSLGRGELVRRISTFKGRFKLDFTPEFLSKQSVDRLRHILLAALLSRKTQN